MNNISALLPLENKTALLILMIVLIAFVVLLTVLGIVFIVALRKRRPVVKVLMSQQNEQGGSAAKSETAATSAPVNTFTSQVNANVSNMPKDGDIIPTYIIESYDSVYYHILLQNSYPVGSSKRQERYSSVKNEIHSYEKVKERTSVKREVPRSAQHSVEKNHTKGIRIAMARRKQA